MQKIEPPPKRQANIILADRESLHEDVMRLNIKIIPSNDNQELDLTFSIVLEPHHQLEIAKNIPLYILRQAMKSDLGTGF